MHGVTKKMSAKGGEKWVVMVPVYGRGNIYGGTFADCEEACSEADGIRFWLFRTGLVSRELELNKPDRYSDESMIPPCPPKVAKMAAEARVEDTSKAKVTSMSDLLIQLAELTARVEALESRNRILGPGPL